nr:hypothetical protein [Tanacetum cinerariifolium]
RDHIEVDPRDDREEFEASAGDTVVLGIDPRSVPVADEESEEPAGKDSSSSSGTRDGTVRSVEDIPVNLDGVIRDFYHHMFEVRIDRIVRIETTQRQLEADQLIASGERTRMTERIESLRLENLKQVGPLPAHRLAWRRVSPCSSDHRPSSSSSPTNSSPFYSSGFDAPESSSGDSSERPLHSSSHSARPSHKRCRSLTYSVPSSTPVMRSLAHTRVDLLPPRKRFKDSYSLETSME